MAKKRLNGKNIDQLLVHYRNERRRLIYQLDLVKGAIADLKQQLAAETAVERPAKKATDGTTKRKAGRPRKAATAKPAGKPGRPPKRERKVRPLNDWDTAVMDVITKSGRLMPKEEILVSLQKWAAKHHPDLSDAEVEAFLTRTLQKLSGKKKLLGTHHSGLRRGYHYGLIDWFFQSSGKLRRNHYDRLVLTAEGKAA